MIQIIDPTIYPGWDKLLATNAQSTFFHTAAWARTLCNSYRYKPLYFTTTTGDTLTGLIAVMEVNSFLTGKRGVSLPFTDRCEPLAADADQFDTLLQTVVRYGKEAGWQSLQVRGGDGYLQESLAEETFLNHVLALSGTADEIFSAFRGSTRRNIRKAEKQAVTVEKRHDPDAVKAFYRLNCMTRREHGLPPQPCGFFRNLHDQVVSQKKGCVLLAAHKGRTVAGAVYLFYQDKAIYKYGASDKTYQQLRANNLIMWEAIKTCAAANVTTFDFGRTDLDHEGLRRFKSGWGTIEKTDRYYRYDFKRGDFVQKAGGPKSSYAVFKHMPMPLLKLSGRVLYKHVG